ncbi:MAG: nucleotidyltransferase family protein [Candidatus Binatia bacterium]
MGQIGLEFRAIELRSRSFVHPYLKIYRPASAPSGERGLLCAWLRGEPVCWPSSNDAVAERFLFESRYHGVTALLYQQIHLAADKILCPSQVRAELQCATARATAQELIRRRALEEVLASLARRDAVPLLLKGTPLAYTLYPAPSLRSRGDTDLLIQKEDFHAADEVFARLGYERANTVTGELVSSQRSYCKNDDYGVSHSFDLHWRISNSYVFGETFGFDELWSSSIVIPALGAHARGLGAAHALLLACMHRLTHRQAPYYVDGVAYYDSDRLIWLYDIHLLARAMTAGQWERVIEFAAEKGLQEICLDGLQAAATSLGASVPAEVEQRLSLRGNRRIKAVASFNVSAWRWELAGIWAARSWRAGLKLLTEHLFPAGSYMSSKYRITNRKFLPCYYFRRAAEGIWKRL